MTPPTFPSVLHAMNVNARKTNAKAVRSVVRVPVITPVLIVAISWISAPPRPMKISAYSGRPFLTNSVNVRMTRRVHRIFSTTGNASSRFVGPVKALPRTPCAAPTGIPIPTGAGCRIVPRTVMLRVLPVLPRAWMQGNARIAPVPSARWFVPRSRRTVKRSQRVISTNARPNAKGPRSGTTSIALPLARTSRTTPYVQRIRTARP